VPVLQRCFFDDQCGGAIEICHTNDAESAKRGLTGVKSGFTLLVTDQTGDRRG
jgi:hypothetical protein